MTTKFSNIQRAILIALCLIAAAVAVPAANAGLIESIYETPGATGSSGSVPGVPTADQPAVVGSPGNGPAPTDTYVTTLQTDLHGVTPTYTYTNNADMFAYNGGDGTTVNNYMGSDAPGVGSNTGSTDNTNNYNVVYDANGFIKVGTTGNYTFTFTQADDAARVYVGGNHQVGQTSSLVAETNYMGNLTPTSGTVTLTAGHSYPFEVFTYQGWGGANLGLNITGQGTVAFFTTSTPEPSSFVLGGLAATGLLLVSRRRRRA